MTILSMFNKERKERYRKREKKLSKNDKNTKSMHKSKTKRKNGNRTHTCTHRGTS